MRKSRVERRSFLKIAAVATATSGCGRKSSWRFFSEAEAATMAALADQYIPEDSHPGAARAGVVNFLDIQLTKHYKPLQQRYRTGLAKLDDSARKLHGESFAELEPAQQHAMVVALESAEPDFFNMTLAHTMQGFYGSPRHGGNRDGVSWKMLGVPQPPVRGRA
jgi:gluconate 2-dehydrogenase gamma chain